MFKNLQWQACIGAPCHREVNMKKMMIFAVFALCGAVCLLLTGQRVNAAEGTTVDIQVDCGAHASYSSEYQVCFCDDGYKAGADGQTCEKEKMTETAPAPATEKPAPAPAPEKPAPASTSKPAGSVVPNAPAVEPSQPAAPLVAGKILEDGDEAVLFRGARVRVELLETLSSQDASEGDQVLFRVVDQIAVDNVTLVSRDAVAYGIVNYARPAKGWGKSGQIDIDIKSMIAVDGTVIPLSAFITDQQNWDPTAAGKTLASALVAGPLGLAIGGGMKGKKVVVPKGNVYEVYVDRDSKINISGAPSGPTIKPETQPVRRSDAIKPAVKKPEPAPEPVVEKPVAEKPAVEKPVDSGKVSVEVEKAGDETPATPGKETCFGVCKNETGSAFKTCMSNCNGCLKTCDGLSGDIYSLCMKKCSQPDGFDI